MGDSAATSFEPTREAMVAALTTIYRNATSWHGDDAAKGRALAVIAEVAQLTLEGPKA